MQQSMLDLISNSRHISRGKFIEPLMLFSHPWERSVDPQQALQKAYEESVRCTPPGSQPCTRPASEESRQSASSIQQFSSPAAFTTELATAQDASVY
jgi:hypothetical protein